MAESIGGAEDPISGGSQEERQSPQEERQSFVKPPVFVCVTCGIPKNYHEDQLCEILRDDRLKNIPDGRAGLYDLVQKCINTMYEIEVKKRCYNDK